MIILADIEGCKVSHDEVISSQPVSLEYIMHVIVVTQPMSGLSRRKVDINCEQPESVTQMRMLFRQLVQENSLNLAD